MADSIVARSRRGEIEARMGVQPIDELLDARSTLVEDCATLRARHGGFGTWDHERKSMLAGIKSALRARYVRDGVKVTEAQLDDEAHASPDYREFITTATLERAEWLRAENKINRIDQTINRDQALARFITSETRLGG